MQPPASVASNPPQAVATMRLARLRLEALGTFFVLASVALGLAVASGFGSGFIIRALLVFVFGFGLMLRALPTHAPCARLGAANRVTLTRFMMIALLAAACGEPAARSNLWAWAAVAIATTAALLDAVDGPLARSSGLASDFGARFDMECDAFLILVLSLLVLWFDKAGAWVLAAGLLRYAFVAAARALPWMAQNLPPSLRRKTVCVLQITCLIVCLGPVVEVEASRFVAAAGLAALCASFALDIAWLFQHRRTFLKEQRP